MGPGPEEKRKKTMKKLFALMLALCLVCGCAALADNEIAWDQVEPMLTENGLTGEFVTFDQIAVKLWIPAGMTAVEELPEGYIGYYAADDGDAVSVVYVDVDGMDLNTYAEQVAANGGTEIEAGTVNGLPCISYEYTTDDGLLCMCCAFTTQAGYILEVSAGPLADDNAKLGASCILASIQAAE